MPIAWALIALRSGTRVNSPMATITLGENILKLRVVSATFEVRRKLYENANPIAKKWVENLPHMPKWWYFSPKSWYIDDTFWEVYGKYHYDKLSDYQSVAKEVKRNDDTMKLFSKKKLFVRKSRRLFAEPSRIKPCYFKWLSIHSIILSSDGRGASKDRILLSRYIEAIEGYPSWASFSRHLYSSRARHSQARCFCCSCNVGLGTKEVNGNIDSRSLPSMLACFRHCWTLWSRLRLCLFRISKSHDTPQNSCCDLQGVSRERWFLHRNSWCASWKWFC